MAKTSPITSRTFIFLSLSFWCIYFFSFWSTGYFYRNQTLYAKSLGTWADGAAHLTYTSSMAYRPNFPQFLPVYYGVPFVYPFIADGLAAILVRAGINIFSAYSLLGAGLSLTLVFTLFHFYRLFTQNAYLSVLSLHLFLFSGGLGFIHFIQDFYQQGLSILRALPKDYTHLSDDAILWTNVITGEFIPQRAMLLGFVLALPILSWLYRLQKTNSFPSNPRLIISGTIIGLLPLIHPHTLLTFSFVLIWAIFFTLRSKSSLKSWLYFLIPFLTLSLPLYFFHLKPVLGGSFLKYQPGWLAPGLHISWLRFWFNNWGLFFPLSIIGLFFTKPFQRSFLIPFIIIFIICNLFRFQPYDWDNTKIFTWVYLVFAPVVATVIYKLYRQHFVGKLIAIVFFGLLTATGFIDVIRQLQPQVSIPMFTQEELNLADQVKTLTQPETIFLTSSSHTHVIPTLTGRQILMGYPGWLWTYGIDYGKRQSDIQTIYSGSPQTTPLFQQYQIDYLVIGPSEIEQLHPNQTYFDSHFPVLIRTDNYTIYQISLP